MFDLAGRVASVTGGHGGIGATALAERGARAATSAGSIAVFLASEEARFVTGTAIPVDGGFASMG